MPPATCSRRKGLRRRPEVHRPVDRPKEDWYNQWIKALLLAAKNSYKDAQASAELAFELGLKANDAFFPETEIRKALTEWSSKSVAAR